MIYLVLSIERDLYLGVTWEQYYDKVIICEIENNIINNFVKQIKPKQAYQSDVTDFITFYLLQKCIG